MSFISFREGLKHWSVLFGAAALAVAATVTAVGPAGATVVRQDARATDTVTRAAVPPSSPSASWTLNGRRVDVFRVANGALQQKYWDATGWHGWFGFSAPPSGFRGAPSATWAADGSRVDVFATGTNGRLYQLRWTRTTGWSNWFDLGAA
jgi:hypothetical protein